VVLFVVGLPGVPALAADNPPWPELLPGVALAPGIQPHPVENCRRASLACIDDLLVRLEATWRRQDAACDHRALFTLAYIRITQGLRRAVLDGTIHDPQWMTYTIVYFSNHYFQALSDYDAGRPVPAAWRVTLDAAAHGEDNGGQDVLLASSAHTQHDLPFVYAEMGVTTPQGQSRKPDHDAVNAINAAVFDALETYYAEHYDPFFSYIQPLPPLNQGTLEMVKGWRELAWRNAERLLSARTAEERQGVADEIDLNSRLWAQMIDSYQPAGYRAMRDSFCSAHHEIKPTWPRRPSGRRGGTSSARGTNHSGRPRARAHRRHRRHRRPRPRRHHRRSRR